MAAKGTESKLKVFSKLKEVFPNSFWEDENKILRIPLDEDGSRVEIKVTLTAAKNLMGDSSPTSAFNQETINIPDKITSIEERSIEPTQEEKERVATLLKTLNL